MQWNSAHTLRCILKKIRIFFLVLIEKKLQTSHTHTHTHLSKCSMRTRGGKVSKEKKSKPKEKMGGEENIIFCRGQEVKTDGLHHSITHESNGLVLLQGENQKTQTFCMWASSVSVCVFDSVHTGLKFTIDSSGDCKVFVLLHSEKGEWGFDMPRIHSGLFFFFLQWRKSLNSSLSVRCTMEPNKLKRPGFCRLPVWTMSSLCVSLQNTRTFMLLLQ